LTLLGGVSEAAGFFVTSEATTSVVCNLLATLLSCIIAAKREALSGLSTSCFALLGLLEDALLVVLSIIACISCNLLAVAVWSSDADSLLSMLLSLWSALFLARTQGQLTAFLGVSILSRSAESNGEGSTLAVLDKSGINVCETVSCCCSTCAFLVVARSLDKERTFFNNFGMACSCNGALDVAAVDVLLSAFLCLVALAKSASESSTSSAFASQIFNGSLLGGLLTCLVNLAGISKSCKACN
jgi:hypothetical protein